MPIVICKDCRWCKKGGWFSWAGATCKHPSAAVNKVTYNLVTGEKEEEEKFKYCSIHRSRDYDGKHCGPDGKFFEPKNEKERKVFMVEKKLDKEVFNG